MSQLHPQIVNFCLRAVVCTTLKGTQRGKMMKILFISGADKKFDGRTRELESILKRIGNVTSLTPSPENVAENDITVKSPDKGYVSFIMSVAAACRDIEDVDIIFADNRKASVPALRAKKKYKNAKLVYDARELYFYREMTSLSGKIGCVFEKRMLEKADFVICAGRERKEIMEKEYNLKNPVMVFENFRKLVYDGADTDGFAEKYAYLFNGGRFNIISTAGCEPDRGTEELIKALGKMDFSAAAVLVGCKDDDNRRAMERLVKESGNPEVAFIPRVGMNELKYLIGKSDVGIAVYHKRNMNNKYCSSGKIYEYLYEGIPIVTSDNPPLRHFNDKYHVGESVEDLAAGIKLVHDNYDFYKDNVNGIVEKGVVEKGQEEFKEILEKNLKGNVKDMEV